MSLFNRNIRPKRAVVRHWVCSGYADCLENDTQVCNAVSDNNNCGDSYGGDYSEFSPQSCIFGLCYQEFSTIGTECGGIANPNNFSQGGIWDGGGGYGDNPATCVDGNWSSSCCSFSESWVEQNFTKLQWAYGTIWTTYGGEIVNDTIPQDCWDAYPGDDFLASLPRETTWPLEDSSPVVAEPTRRCPAKPTIGPGRK